MPDYATDCVAALAGAFGLNRSSDARDFRTVSDAVRLCVYLATDGGTSSDGAAGVREKVVERVATLRKDAESWVRQKDKPVAYLQGVLNGRPAYKAMQERLREMRGGGKP